VSKSEKKNKALIKACRSNDMDALKRAFTRELDFWGERYNEAAEINCTDGAGNTPLMYAAEGGYRAIVDNILMRGADVNLRNREGVTALMKAAESGNKDILSLLLAKGADINAKDNEGQTALMLAAEEGQSEMVTFLLGRQADINVRDNDGRTALWRSAERGDVVSLRALLDHGIEIDGQDNDGNTALSRAAYREKVSAVELLLAHNARADLKNNDGKLAEDRTVSTNIKTMLKARMQRQQVEKVIPSGVASAQPVLPETPQGASDAPEAPSPIRTAMEREGLDPKKSEHWIPMGDEAIDYVQAGVQSPRFLSTSFNFAAQQFSAISGNLLTGDRIVTQSGSLEEFPNQGLVAMAYEKLVELGKTPRASAFYKKPPAGPL
jgi:hypothetical protein